MVGEGFRGAPQVVGDPVRGDADPAAVAQFRGAAFLGFSRAHGLRVPGPILGSGQRRLHGHMLDTDHGSEMHLWSVCFR